MTQQRRLVDSVNLKKEGTITPDYGHDFYYGFASASGFFTEILSFAEDEPTTVDLDAVPSGSSGLAGTMIATQYGYAPQNHNYQLRFIGPSGQEINIVPNLKHQFAISNLEQGDWAIKVHDGDGHWEEMGMKLPTLKVTIDESMQYNDLVFDDPIVLD